MGLKKGLEKNMEFPGQMDLFEFLEENYRDMPDVKINIEGVINIGTLTDFTVHSTYSDMFLIINMLDDYAGLIEQYGVAGNILTDYMLGQFRRISGELAEQIHLDKEKMYKKCRKKAEDKHDVGEDAMVLAAKKKG